MEWLEEIPGFWVQRLEWFAGLAAAFAVLAWLMPCNRGMSWWRSLRAKRCQPGHTQYHKLTQVHENLPSIDAVRLPSVTC